MTRLLVLMWLCAAPAATAGEPRLIQADSAHQLLLDTRLVQSVTNAELRLGGVMKEGGTLLPADQPWENATNNLYPNVAWDPDAKRFRLWYKCVVHDADAIAKMAKPVTVHDQGWYLLHAESADGLKWVKPTSRDFPFDGRPTNAVAQDTPNVGVLRDAADPDPKRRYKMVFDTGLGQLKVRFSPDGLRWGDPVPAVGFGPRNGDTHTNAFWDPRLKRYVLFTKLYLGERLVSRFESTDFVNWTGGDVVLRSRPDEGTVTQTYCLTAFPYGNVWLGYVMLYRAGGDRAVDCELAWSADSLHWQRAAPGRPFIPRGKKGDGDSACVYAQAGPMLAQDDRLLLYYGGSDTPHVGWKRHCLLRRATLRPDGFAGFAPIDSAKPAEVVTEPLRVTGKALAVRLDAPKGGGVRAVVLDDPTFGERPSDLLSADGLLTWNGKVPAELVGRVVRLKFVLDRATLYSVTGAEQLPRVECDTGVRRFEDKVRVGLKVTPVVGQSAAGATVRYTTDGSEPGPKSAVYAQPLELTATTRVRAKVFTEGSDRGGAEFDATFTRGDWAVVTTPPKGAKAVLLEDTFEKSAGGWKGTDRVEWLAPEKGSSGTIRVHREKPNTPFAVLTFGPQAHPEFRGDWPKAFGSPAARLSWRMAAPAAGGWPRVEVFAAGSSGWFRELPTPLSADGRVFTADVRFDWTDDEARAAGWRPTASAFSWADTWRHVDRLVIGPTVQGGHARFDLSDVRVQSAWPKSRD